MTIPRSDNSPKGLLRQMIRERLAADPAPSLEAFHETLLASPLFQRADTLVGYIAIQQEIPLDVILKTALQAGKKLLLPRFCGKEYTLAEIRSLEDDLVLGHFRIPEPREDCPVAAELSPDALWLIPGLAFDSQGHRLGRGGGFYDRLRQKFPQGTALGICRECQLLPDIPADPWDLPVHALLTPTSRIQSCYDISR